MDMRKKETKDKTIVVRFTESEFDQLQDFINSIGVDKSTFIRNSTSSFITDFYRNDHDEDMYSKNPIKQPQIPYFEDFDYDIELERSITSSNKDETFFKSSTIPDKYLIQYGGSRFSMGIMDKLKLESFIYDELGFPENHKINWNSPLVGLLVSFSKWKRSREF
jgi:hypothetical protein